MWAVLSVVINTYALLFLHIFIKTHITLSLYLKKNLYIYPAYYVVFLFLCIIIRHVCHIEFSFFNIIFFLLRLSKKKTSESPPCEPRCEFQSDGFVSEQEAKIPLRLNTYKYQSV